VFVEQPGGEQASLSWRIRQVWIRRISVKAMQKSTGAEQPRRRVPREAEQRALPPVYHKDPTSAPP